MLKNPFAGLKRHEWLIWGISMLVVTVSILLSPNVRFSTLAASLVGVTALIFVARGDVWGQILSVVFALLYALTSFEFRYYGEMITYLGMTAPSAIASTISWLRHPYKKGVNEVKIHKLTAGQKWLMAGLTIAVTVGFYFILRALDTPNLLISTISITTSFMASYLVFFRNSYYALAYALNDIVLIIMWILAAIESLSFLPMIFCFVMFLLNDLYGFISWKLREKKQQEGK